MKNTKLKQRIGMLLFLLASIVTYGQFTFDEVCNNIRNRGYTVSSSKFDYVGAGRSIYGTMRFLPQYKYIIIGYTGSEHVKIVNLWLNAENGEWVYKDVGISNAPMVEGFYQMK